MLDVVTEKYEDTYRVGEIETFEKRKNENKTVKYRGKCKRLHRSTDRLPGRSGKPSKKD